MNDPFERCEHGKAPPRWGFLFSHPRPNQEQRGLAALRAKAEGQSSTDFSPMWSGEGAALGAHGLPPHSPERWRRKPRAARVRMGTRPGQGRVEESVASST